MVTPLQNPRLVNINLHAQLPVWRSANFFSVKGLSETAGYLACSYLSPINNQYCVITKSITLDNNNYHLVAVHDSRESFVLITALKRALKVASYFTVFLPILAIVTIAITRTRDYYYVNSNAISISHQKIDDVFFFCLQHFHKEAQAIASLNSSVLYQKNGCPNSLLVRIFFAKDPIQKSLLVNLSRLITADPGSLLTQQDCDSLFNNLLKIYDNQLSVEQAAVIIALNNATQGRVHKHLTQKQLDDICKYNLPLWKYLTSKANPFPLDPSLIFIDAYQHAINRIFDLAGINLDTLPGTNLDTLKIPPLLKKIASQKEPTTQSEWRHLYRQAALKNHTDKVSEANKEEHHKKFLELGELWLKVQSLKQYEELPP